jgi:hypothetical protein
MRDSEGEEMKYYVEFDENYGSDYMYPGFNVKCSGTGSSPDEVVFTVELTSRKITLNSDVVEAKRIADICAAALNAAEEERISSASPETK